LPPANVIEPPVSIPTPPAAPQIIPGQFASIAEAEAGMETLHPHIKFDFQGMHIDAINPTAAEFHRLAQEYPDTAARLRYIGGYRNKQKIVESGHSPELHNDPDVFSQGEFAHVLHGGKRMSLNPKYYDNPEKFLKEILTCETAGWFAPGKYSFEYVMTHEFGHLVDFWLEEYGFREGDSAGIPANARFEICKA
jgi:hypothetical protein